MQTIDTTAAPPTWTPWGRTQAQSQVIPGVWFVSTAGHGGFWLNPQRRRDMPKALLGKRKGRTWFEEDCEAALVILAFAAEFPADQVEYAHSSARRWHTDEYEAFTGQTVPTEESIERRERAFREAHANDYVVTAAWGEWHDQVPTGFVGVAAVKGGRQRNGAVTADTAYFLVPAAEYQHTRCGHFVVDEARHQRVDEIR